jgi:hypothetical protein
MSYHVNLVDQVSRSFKSAMETDLSDFQPGLGPMCRPLAGDTEMFAFVQRWGTSSLGFNRGKKMSLQVITRAMTVVVEFDYKKEAAVYFNGKFCYLIDLSDEKTKKNYTHDLSRHNMAHIYEAMNRYKLKKTYEKSENNV